MNIEEFVNNCENRGGVKYEVSPEIYYSFQRVSSDYNPLHTDEAYATAHGFASRVMYGNILNAFVSHFVGMTLPTRDVIIQSQDLNYHKPVYLHDRLELQYALDSYSEAANSITFKLKFYKQTEAKPQLVAKGHVSVGLLTPTAL
jgi:acyl dehydratase